MMIMEKIRTTTDLDVVVSRCADGKLSVVLETDSCTTEIKGSPVDLRKMCNAILEECDRAQFCHYIPIVGHA